MPYLLLLSHIIITTTIQGTIHKTSTKSSHASKIPTTKIYKVMETFSQISTRYLVHINMNKTKLEKETKPKPSRLVDRKIYEL